MRKALKIALIVVLVIAVITLAGVLLYRFFIGSLSLIHISEPTRH